MTRIAEYKSVPSKLIAAQRNLNYLGNCGFLRRFGYNFSPKFKLAIRNPRHILGRFFREVDFRKNREIMEEAKHSRGLLNIILGKAFSRFIGITEGMERQIFKGGIEIIDKIETILQAVAEGHPILETLEAKIPEAFVKIPAKYLGIWITVLGRDAKVLDYLEYKIGEEPLPGEAKELIKY